MKILYPSAIDNYPEDQAHLDAEYALDLFKIEGRDYYHQWLIKERSSVIHNLFDDSAHLERYIERFNKLTATTTNFYM